MSIFLSHADLKELTGYTHHKLQREWLDDNGIPYRVRPDGMPVLTVRVYEESLLKLRITGPDFSALKKVV